MISSTSLSCSENNIKQEQREVAHDYKEKQDVFGSVEDTNEFELSRDLENGVYTQHKGADNLSQPKVELKDVKLEPYILNKCEGNMPETYDCDQGDKKLANLMGAVYLEVRGTSVFTLKALPKNVILGPYKKHEETIENGGLYMDELEHGSMVDIRGGDNWTSHLRYISNTKNLAKQNITIVENSGELYYKTCKDIAPDEELLMYSYSTSINYIGEDTDGRNVPKYHCRYCNIGLKSEKFKYKHETRWCRYLLNGTVVTVADTELKCHFCTAVFKNSNELVGHERNCRASKTPKKKEKEKKRKEHSCEICPYSTSDASLLKKHRLVHNKEGAKTFGCDDCDFRTYHRRNLSRHKLTHDTTGRKLYNCSSCDYASNIKRNLTRHVLYLHTDSYTEYPCEHCNRIFKTKLSLENHMFRYHPEAFHAAASKMYECPDCPYKCLRKIDIDRHYIRHMKVKPLFKCDTCQFTTCYRSIHYKHLAMHRKVKNYFCTVCEMGFYEKVKMDQHILHRHREDEQLVNSVSNKFHICSFCPFKTMRLKDMEVHIGTHKKKRGKV